MEFTLCDADLNAHTGISLHSPFLAPHTLRKEMYTVDFILNTASIIAHMDLPDVSLMD